MRGGGGSQNEEEDGQKRRMGKVGRQGGGKQLQNEEEDGQSREPRGRTVAERRGGWAKSGAKEGENSCRTKRRMGKVGHLDTEGEQGMEQVFRRAARVCSNARAQRRKAGKKKGRLLTNRAGA